MFCERALITKLVLETEKLQVFAFKFRQHKSCFFVPVAHDQHGAVRGERVMGVHGAEPIVGGWGRWGEIAEQIIVIRCSILFFGIIITYK